MAGFHIPGWMLQPYMVSIFVKHRKIQAYKCMPEANDIIRIIIKDFIPRDNDLAR